MTDDMNNKILSLSFAWGMAAAAFAQTNGDVGNTDGSYDFIPFLPEWVNMLLFFAG